MFSTDNHAPLVCACLVGNESRQIEHDGYFGNGKYGHGQLFKVTNLATALEAIREIVEEGEGSSPCNPISWVQGNASDLSHYFLFDSIVEGSLVEVCNVTNPDSAPLNDAVSIRWSFGFIQAAAGHSPGMSLCRNITRGRRCSAKTPLG